MSKRRAKVTDPAKFFKQLKVRRKAAEKAFDAHEFFRQGLVNYTIMDIFEQGFQAGMDYRKRRRKK